MMYYVTKWDSKSMEMVADYGTYEEKDVKLIVRGYKPFKPEFDESKTTMYMRQNSRYYYEVTEI